MSRWLIVFMLVGVFASGTAYGANASGYCHLEGETNHAGTKVDFYRYPLGEICYTTSTDASGYYYKGLMTPGYYDVIFSHPCFIPDGLSHVEIVGSTIFPPIELEPASCEALDWHEYPYLPPGTSIWFPEDEGKHNPLSTYPIEWWYVNFHLTGRSSGHKYGAMVAIFKDGPMRLFSISDLYQQQNYTHCDVPGVLIASTSELDLHYTDEIGDPDIWRNMTYVASDLVCEGNLMPYTYRLEVDAIAREDDNPMQLDIIMSSSKAPMMVGGDGFVDIGSGWSYYYSLTKVKVFEESQITVHDLTEEVSGYAWIDHQWGDFIPILGDTVSWEWFSIKLDDLREIMVADVWVNGEPLGSYSGGFNLFNGDCSLELSDDYTIRPLAFWTNPDPGCEHEFATQWRIEEASKEIDLVVTADYNNQMMKVEILEAFPLGCFWEGVCSVTGTIEGMPVSGKAYAELTHADPNHPPTAFIDEISPNPAEEGDTVTFSGHGTDADGSIVSYYWSSSSAGSLSTDSSFSTCSLSVGTDAIYFRVQDDDGAWSEEVLEILVIQVGVEDEEWLSLPDKFSLAQNYPNPFNPITEIAYALPKDCNVKLTIYNVLGQKVASLVDGKQKGGYKTVKWDASSFSSGIYFFRLKAGDFVQTRKMVLLK